MVIAPALDRIRVVSVGQARSGKITRERTLLRFSISWDLVAELFRLHDELYKVYFYGPPPSERWRRHRVELARLADMGLPSVLMRIEPPNYDPHGARLRRSKGARAFTVQVAARKLRVKPDIAPKVLEHMISPEMRGIIATFPDEDMEDLDDLPPLRPRQQPIPIDDQDMAVYRERKR